MLDAIGRSSSDVRNAGTHDIPDSKTAGEFPHQPLGSIRMCCVDRSPDRCSPCQQVIDNRAARV